MNIPWVVVLVAAALAGLAARWLLRRLALVERRLGALEAGDFAGFDLRPEEAAELGAALRELASLPAATPTASADPAPSAGGSPP